MTDTSDFDSDFAVPAVTADQTGNQGDDRADGAAAAPAAQDGHPEGYVDLTQPPAPAPVSAQDPTSEPPAPTEAAPAFDANATAAQDGPADDADAPNVLKSPFPLPDLRDNADDETDTDPSRDEFTTVYDIIDQLEATLEEAKGSLFSPGTVRVDRDQFADDLDQLKKMLPVQLERASALMREAERRLESAQTQANAIVASAQSRAADLVKEANEQAQFLAGQENVTELARQKARTILNTAQAKADHLTQGADEYSTKVMESLRDQLTKMSGDVDAGLNVLYERRKSASQDLPHLDISDYPEAQ